MEMRCLCVLLVTMVAACSAGPVPNKEALKGLVNKHVQRLTRSEDVEGSVVALLLAADDATNEERVQSRRDVESHASNPASAKSRFSLQLPSGERLRMSLTRRSVDVSGIKIRERTAEGTREVTLKRRNCFFQGPLEGQQGQASLSMCGGKLHGMVTTEKRHYELHSLPSLSGVSKRASPMDMMEGLEGMVEIMQKIQDQMEPSDSQDTPEMADTSEISLEEDDDKRSLDDVMPVLLTWRRQTDDDTDDAMEGLEMDSIEIPEEEMEKEDEKRSTDEIRDLTIEIGDVIDSFYLEKLEKDMGINDTDDVIDFQLTKWSSVAGVLSDVDQVGWKLNIRIVTMDIWRTNPDWYPVGPRDTTGYRLKRFCHASHNLGGRNTYDQLTLHTHIPTHSWSHGVAYVNVLCSWKWNCALVNLVSSSYMTEIHELGHNMGLSHESSMGACKTDDDPVKGFMQGNRDHFRSCYRKITDSNFRKSCLHRNYFENPVAIYNEDLWD